MRRLFIGIEEQSIIRPQEVAHILETHRPAGSYEVLPICSDCFPPLRNIGWKDETLRSAFVQGKKILAHYHLDIKCCVVVYRTAGYINIRKVRHEVTVDEALGMSPQGKYSSIVLNDIDHYRHPSGPQVHSHLLDNLINFALIDMAGQYADAV